MLLIHNIPGYVPGMCHSSNLKVGRDYIVFLGLRDNGDLVVKDAGVDATTGKEEVALVCGLKPMVLNGTNQRV